MAAAYKKNLIRDVLTIIDDERSQLLLARLDHLSDKMIHDLYVSMVENNHDHNNQAYLTYVQKTEHGVEKLSSLFDKLLLSEELNQMHTHNGNA